MDSLLDSAATIYPVSDLLPGSEVRWPYPESRPLAFVAVARTQAGGYTTRGGWVLAGFTDLDGYGSVLAELGDATAPEPSVAEVRARLCRVGYRTGAPRVESAPTLSAEEIADRFFDRIRLSADDLLADPAFAALARTAAEKGKRFTAGLLRWERKPVVVEAVARVRAVVDAERKAAAEKAAAERAEREARLERERPVRDAVTAAYEGCGFRTCRQGHAVRVEIGDRVGATAGTSSGDRYSSRCTYRRVTSSHTLRVRPDWHARVAPGGAVLHDGRLVLDAEAVGCTADYRPVYRLTFARQGRGTGLETDACEAVAKDGRWVECGGRRANVTRMPAPILADYLDDRGAITPEQGAAMRAGAV